MILPKFIHILSTKSAKCAIYKANFFAFRLITYVHYIITNNNAIFAVCLRVLCYVSYAVADMWMMIYALSLPVCRVEVD